MYVTMCIRQELVIGIGPVSFVSAVVTGPVLAQLCYVSWDVVIYHVYGSQRVKRGNIIYTIQQIHFTRPTISNFTKWQFD